MAIDLILQPEHRFASSPVTRRLLPVLRLLAIARFMEATIWHPAESMSHELMRL